MKPSDTRAGQNQGGNGRCNQQQNPWHSSCNMLSYAKCFCDPKCHPMPSPPPDYLRALDSFAKRPCHEESCHIWFCSVLRDKKRKWIQCPFETPTYFTTDLRLGGTWIQANHSCDNCKITLFDGSGECPGHFCPKGVLTMAGFLRCEQHQCEDLREIPVLSKALQCRNGRIPAQQNIKLLSTHSKKATKLACGETSLEPQLAPCGRYRASICFPCLTSRDPRKLSSDHQAWGLGGLWLSQPESKPTCLHVTRLLHPSGHIRANLPNYNVCRKGKASLLEPGPPCELLSSIISCWHASLHKLVNFVFALASGPVTQTWPAATNQGARSYRSLSCMASLGRTSIYITRKIIHPA